jgi:DNA repair photolyase
MTVVDISPVKQREITSGTREWADHNANCIKGCSNDCRYCYAKLMAKRFGRCREDTWKYMVVNNSAVERKYGKLKGRVMFPSSHDIIDKPEIQEACFIVIEKLVEAGNDVLITTKPRLSVTGDIIERFYPFKEQLQFRFTITSLDNQLLAFWEPNAPTYEERLASLKYAYEKTFKTSVSIEPFLDYAPQTLIQTLSPYVTESIWLGPMNYIPQNGIDSADEQQYAGIRQNYEIDHLRDIHRDLKDYPLIRFKDSMANKLNSNLR